MIKEIKTDKNNAYGWYIVFVSAFIGCFLSAGFPQFSMTISPLADKMQVSQDLLLLGDTVKSTAIVLSMMASGFFYRKLGARKVMILGLLIVVIPQSMYPYNNSIIIFFILKFIQGFTGLVFPVFLLLIMDWVYDSQTGFATAVFNGIFFCGGGIGSTFAGFVINRWGWAASYHAISIAVLILFALLIVTVKERPAPGDVRLSDENDNSAPLGKPASIPDLLKIPYTLLLFFGLLPTMFSVQAISVDLPLYGAYLGYDELQIGRLGIAATVGMLISCLISGKCSDYFARKSKDAAFGRVCVLMFGCAITAASVVFLILSSSTGFSLLFAAILFFSFASSWGLGSFYSILPEVYDNDTLTIATGFVGGIGDMAMPAAPFVVGVVFGINGLWSIGWGVCGLIALVGVAACLLVCVVLSRDKGRKLST